MLWFAAGMVLPLVILAFVWRRIPWVQRIVRPRELHIGRWHNSWNSVIGGLFTIAVGVLLLATSGTSTLGELLGTSRQASLESWVLRATASVPNWLAILIPLLALAIWFAIWHSRRPESREPEPTSPR